MHSPQHHSLEELSKADLRKRPWSRIGQWEKWPLAKGSPIPAIMRFILAKGFHLTLVGGGFRSLLQRPAAPLDQILDFEIRHPQISAAAWPAALRDLMNQLPKVFPAAVVQEHFYLSFQIRAAVNDAGPWQIDITSPRLEQHHAAAHRGLAAQYFPDLPYAQAWRRRDFTINAMGVEYRRTMTKTRTGKRKEQQAYRLIDPFNGWGDWQQKKLNIISEDFYQDPVRFLRFCRWLEQGFTAGERSVAQGRMDLSLLSKQLLGREALKGNFFALMAAFIKWGKAWQVKWPAWPIGDWPWERWAAINDRPFSTIAAAAKTIWECDPAWGQRFWEFWELSLKEGQRIQQAVAWWAKVQQLPWVEMRELNRCGPALRRDPPPHPLPAWLNLFAKSCKAGRCPLKVVQPPWAQEVCGPWTQMIELFGRRPGEDEKTYLAKWSATYPPEEQDALKAYAFLLFRRF